MYATLSPISSKEDALTIIVARSRQRLLTQLGRIDTNPGEGSALRRKRARSNSGNGNAMHCAEHRRSINNAPEGMIGRGGKDDPPPSGSRSDRVASRCITSGRRGMGENGGI